MDSMRIYGIKGKPFPWKITSYKMAEIERKLDQSKEILQIASEKVLDWANCMCGIMFDKEESIITGANIDE